MAVHSPFAFPSTEKFAFLVRWYSGRYNFVHYVCPRQDAFYHVYVIVTLSSCNEAIVTSRGVVVKSCSSYQWPGSNLSCGKSMVTRTILETFETLQTTLRIDTNKSIRSFFSFICSFPSIHHPSFYFSFNLPVFILLSFQTSYFLPAPPWFLSIWTSIFSSSHLLEGLSVRTSPTQLVQRTRSFLW